MTSASILEKEINILLVEDNPADVELTREGLGESRMKVRLDVANDGEQAMEMLYQRGDYYDVPRPDLILLDLNIPRKHGRDVLREIKSDPELRSIPVVVLTTSAAEKDVQTAYELQANSYITKPVSFDHFVEIVRELETFWFRIVELPTRYSYREAS